MKSKDLTPTIMSKVASYERKRIHAFRLRLMVVLALCGVVIAGSTAIIVWQLYELQAFDLLTLFREDSRIIAEFWQDTLLVFWDQISPEWLTVGILSLVVIGGILLVTKRRRAVNKKKLSQISKYSKN